MFLAAQLTAHMALAEHDARVGTAAESPDDQAAVYKRWALVRSQNFTPYSAEHPAEHAAAEAPRVRSRWV